ncbi:hypothetical protein [Crocinitomix catalasitica]|uniref:hypothetical protein n=1 Tax=Crocinitomix catalasitica TaxID=184607 RepID=UPI0012F9DCF9|nr:hypothetical protein [Crocinitomix catalasitica]
MTYFVSFGHNIIPHHHHVESEENCQYEMTKISACSADNSEHDHISHDNHIDEGLMEYLSCLLSNVDHNTSCEIPFVSRTLKLKKQQIEVDIIADFDLPKFEITTTTPIKLTAADNVTIIYHQTHGKVTSLRGPPTI